MDNQFQSLPPLKRLRLMQREQQSKQRRQSGSEMKPSLLPGKKRKESRVDCADAENSRPTYCCLPAKKRVWAIDPDLLSGNPLSPFDLNIEYKPSLEENPVAKNWNGMVGSSLEVEDKENIDPLVKANVSVRSDNHPQNREASKEVEDNGNGNGNGHDEDEEHDGIVCALHQSMDCNPSDPNPDLEDEENIDPLGKENVFVQSDKKPGNRGSTNEVEDNGNAHNDDEEDDGIVCAVCQSTDGDPSDPIVFCDGCDLMAHASCYGNPLVKAIPEGDWFCRQCLASGSSEGQEKTFSCCLCTIKGGALKPTNDGRWAHIVCSLFVPEVYFEDAVGREGINCSEIPQRRWKEGCYVCKTRHGCVIECSEMKCRLAFHVTCGLKEDLCIEYREGKKMGGIVAGFCKEHTKLWEREQETGKFKIVARDEHRM